MYSTLWILYDHCRKDNTPPLDPILSQLNPFKIYYLFVAHYNINMPHCSDLAKEHIQIRALCEILLSCYRCILLPRIANPIQTAAWRTAH
jgi:hypothetical protein